MLDAKELKLVVNPEAQVYIFPSWAGYVGGRHYIRSGSLDLTEKKELVLYVDIGTNGRNVLIDRENIFCCGTAAGPAFEGAQIKYGTRATLGAISAVETEDGDIKIYTHWRPGFSRYMRDRSNRCPGLFSLKEDLLSPTGRLKEDGKWGARLIKEGDSRAFPLSYNPPIYHSGKISPSSS